VARTTGSSGRRSRERRVSRDADRAGRVGPGASGRSATRTIELSGQPKPIHPVPWRQSLILCTFIHKSIRPMTVDEIDVSDSLDERCAVRNFPDTTSIVLNLLNL
jgi:hypothetical protein